MYRDQIKRKAYAEILDNELAQPFYNDGRICLVILLFAIEDYSGALHFLEKKVGVFKPKRILDYVAPRVYLYGADYLHDFHSLVNALWLVRESKGDISMLASTFSQANNVFGGQILCAATILFGNSAETLLRLPLHSPDRRSLVINNAIMGLYYLGIEKDPLSFCAHFFNSNVGASRIIVPALARLSKRTDDVIAFLKNQAKTEDDVALIDIAFDLESDENIRYLPGLPSESAYHWVDEPLSDLYDSKSW